MIRWPVLLALALGALVGWGAAQTDTRPGAWSAPDAITAIIGSMS